MQKIKKDTLGAELRRWFSLSILPHSQIDFTDTKSFDTICTEFLFDYQRYFNENEIDLEKLLSRTELVGILLYRIARFYFVNGDEYKAQQYSLLGRFLTGFEIYYSSKIGKGLKINHGLGTVVGARVVIGENALLHQGITFGDKNGGRPVLGNNVVVYPGAKILGDVRIGNNAVIGANCVCFRSVPDNATVVGIPARIIKQEI